MIQPDFKTFARLAKQGNLVPVYESYTADLLTPVGAHLRIAHGAKYSFLLESVEGGETVARYTFTGANPEEVFRARGRVCTLETGSGQVEFDENPVATPAAYRPIPSGGRAGASSADWRRDRLFRLRHGAAEEPFPPAVATTSISTIAS